MKDPEPHNHILAYTQIPETAVRISPPDVNSPTSATFPTLADRPAPSREPLRLASFPPKSINAENGLNSNGERVSTYQGTNGKDLGISSSGGGISGALSSGVTEMFMSHLLPSTLPAKATSSAPLPAPGRVKDLSSQREPLSLPAMTNNFRRFVARCGVLFWFQDRVEEVLYWRKPVWTYAYMLTWCFICFYPRLILCIPICGLILILLNLQTQTTARKQPPKRQPTTDSSHTTSRPSKDSQNDSKSKSSQSLGSSLLHNSLTATIAAAVTQNNDPSVNPKAKPQADGQSKDDESPSETTVNAQGEEVPAVSGGPPESGVDYYLNLQGIQNMMGLVSDSYDAVLPYISIINPTVPPTSPPPTTFPLSPTHLVMVLLPPAVALPLVPMSVLPYILLPIGLGGPIMFHPAFLPTMRRIGAYEGISRRQLRYWRGVAERWVLTDRLDDRIATSEIREVRVWENQRLDPTWSPSAAAASGSKGEKDGAKKDSKDDLIPPPLAWSAQYLKDYERVGWVRALPKTRQYESLWQEDSVSVGGAGGDSGDVEGDASSDKSKAALSLVPGWSFVPGEDWRVDHVAEWDRRGCDDAGWVYTDDEWKFPSPQPVLDVTGGTNAVKYKVTRRRQWWRRVYSTTQTD